MNYTNYKTGKVCSRDEYIQNGLERGELLYNYNCGCVIIQDRTADAYIVYCHKHEAAPDMYEALKTIKDTMKAGFSHNPQIDSAEIHVQHLHGLWQSCQKITEKALAKAEGKND